MNVGVKLLNHVKKLVKIETGQKSCLVQIVTAKYEERGLEKDEKL